MTVRPTLLAGHDFEQFATVLRNASQGAIFDLMEGPKTSTDNVGADGGSLSVAPGDVAHRGMLSQFAIVCSQRSEAWNRPDEGAFLFAQTSTSTPVGSELWLLESNTWTLVRDLLCYRYTAKTLGTNNHRHVVENAKDHHPFVSPILASDKLRVDLTQDPVLQEMLIVKDWLEKTAPSFTPCNVRKGYLRNTVNHIKRATLEAASFLSSPSNNTSIVHEADPDAPLREGRALEESDLEYENSLNHTAFEYIRRGQFDAALDLFLRVDQPWKAASISGGLLWQDRLYDQLAQKELMSYLSKGEVEILPESNETLGGGIIASVANQDAGLEIDNDDGTINFTGNRNRAVFKSICLLSANAPGTGAYEKALYGAISGSSELVIPICNRWEDKLWANYNRLIEEYISGILSDCPSLLHNIYETKSITIPTPLTSNPDSLSDVFDQVDKSSRITPFTDPFRTFLKHFILNNVEDLYILVSNAIIDDKDSSAHSELTSPQFLRFISHFIIVCSILGSPIDHASTGIILKKYVDILIETQKKDLIALYTSFLDRNAQVEMYAKFLLTLPQSRTASEYLVQAYAYNLDVAAIVKRIVSLTLERGVLSIPFHVDLPNRFHITALGDPITPTERDQIYAVGWFLDFRLTEMHEIGEKSGNRLPLLLRPSVDSTVLGPNCDHAELYLGQALLLMNLLCRNFMLQGRVNCIFELFSFLKAKLQIKDFDEKFGKYSHWIDDENDFGLGIVELYGYTSAVTCLEAWRDWNVVYQVYSKMLARISGGRRDLIQNNPEIVEDFTRKTTNCAKVFEQILTCDWLLSIPLDTDNGGNDDGDNVDLRSRELERIRLLYLPKFAVCYLHLLIETEEWNKSSTKNTRRVLRWLIDADTLTEKTTSANGIYDDGVGIGLTAKSIEYSLKIWNDWGWVKQRYSMYVN